MSNTNNSKYNSEGYYDPTAYYGIKEIIKEENETDKRANTTISMLKFIIRSIGFELIELIERIKIKDTKTGREYR